MDSRIAAAEAVMQMDRYLRAELLKKDGVVQKKKLWENTFAKHQIDKRKGGGMFFLQDHIRAMVYSMLSAGVVWARVESGIDEATGQITQIDDLFHGYDVDYILSSSPRQFVDRIKEERLAGQYTEKQIIGLINTNIPKLIEIEQEYGNIDSCYRRYIIDDDISCLIRMLSSSESILKLSQMGEALNAEYLKNVGYDTAKPDRHIRRILGSKILGCSDKETVPVYETVTIVSEIAEVLGKSAAEVDYILWAYCATGYGEVCTLKGAKCSLCAVAPYCKTTNINKEKGV